MSDNENIEIAIEHQQDKQRFIIPVDGYEAVLEYQLSGKNIDFSRTFVPNELRGKGLAERLVRHGLKWAKSKIWLSKPVAGMCRSF